MSDVTINELSKLLNGLIEEGYGDKEFQIYYDSETTYTSIPRKSRILVFKNSIRFSDYAEPDLPEEGLIKGILKKLDESDDG